MNTAAGSNAASQEPTLEDLVQDWEFFPDLAERWDIPVTRVHNMVSDGRLLTAKVGERHARAVPTLFLVEDGPLEPLKGTISVLRDARFSDDEAIRWLYTPDESLPGRPIDALREGRKTEIRRRAQALAW
ncbi:Rv2175c family DNA-binding protein [Citricoccus sp.]|uniref:Rv2175c family DNA-binding protein n=1 Tax=Citricoccus sp. TaxID=1978372 RepID=UPI0028BE9843|nr:Rv2175c family DNA-binding protein [Citricoccus sp.]